MTEPLRILVVGAHPADVFDQSGGTMAHHVQRGDDVTCVVLTHGARIHDNVISEAMWHKTELPGAAELTSLIAERSDVKANEVRRACKILGVEKIIFFGADDAILLIKEEPIRRLASIIRQLKPDVVITHYPKEGDEFVRSHAIAGQIVLHAIQYAGSVDPGDRNPAHRVAQVFFFGIGAAPIRSTLWDSQGGFYNDVFIDISDVIEKKLAALDCLQSQGYGGLYARKRIESSDGAFGAAQRVGYGEGFIKMNSECHYYLPVTEDALKLARMSDHEYTTRQSYRIKVD